MVLETQRNRAFAALATGAILAFSFPPLPTGFLAWFALIPLFIAIEKSASWKESFRLGVYSGIVFHTSR